MLLLMGLIGLTLHTVGGILIGVTAIRAHYVISREMKLDKVTFAELKRERLIGIFGIFLMIIGYILQVLGK